MIATDKSLSLSLEMVESLDSSVQCRNGKLFGYKLYGRDSFVISLQGISRYQGVLSADSVELRN